MRLSSRLILWHAVWLILTGPVSAQVTTAKWYGIVRDPTGAVIPGAEVAITHQGTSAQRNTVTSDTGEFLFDYLPVGDYAIQIQMPGFKSLVTTRIQLGAGQNIRENYVLDVGEVSQSVTVEGSAPLVNVASAEQRESFTSLQVTELPISRRNVTNLLRLATGVDVGGGSVRINGVGKSGTAVTVDGTDANANPSEGRSMEQYGGRNYIDVMSIDAIQEVQLFRGIMPAEYGGAVSGQVNIISKSGTNAFHGTLFHNYRSHLFSARNPFQASRRSDGSRIPKNREVFNQYGGSLGGPILRDRAFFFFTFEGYRESQFQRVTENVPTPKLRNQILTALPFPETKALLDLLQEPVVPINENIGRFEGVGKRERSEDHFVMKGDLRVTDGSNLSVTYTRNRPFGLDPRAFRNGANDRTYDYAQDRFTTQYVMGSAAWSSETRFGVNRADMERLDHYFTLKDPNKAERIEWQRRIPRLSIQRIGGWGSAEVWQMEGTTYSLDQKVGRHLGQHLLKFGGRYVFYGGSRTNPENPNYAFGSIQDMFANIPTTVNISFGSHGPHSSRMYEVGFFVQDDWRATSRLMLNLGLRYDFYSNNVVKAKGDVPVVIRNLEPAKDLRKFDFGPDLPFDRPTEHDAVNFGPRLGFAYNLDGRGKTVIRGGSAVLFAAHVPALLRQSVAHPVVPFRIIWSKNEAQRLGIKFPLYAEETLDIAIRDVQQSGRRFIFSVIDPNLQNPYTVNYQLNVQRSLGRDLMFEIGYVGLSGIKFPMHRRYNQPDRVTGERPNPLVIPGGHFVDNSERTLYSSLQTSLRKRFSRNFSLDLHYTWGKGLSYTGGDVGVYYGTDVQENTVQDFFNYRIDRGPNTGEVAQRFVSAWLYRVPYFENWGNGVMRHVFGGWQVTGFLFARSGGALRITQSCAGTYHCRVDHTGADPILSKPVEIAGSCRPGARCDLQYLNTAAFQRVPESKQRIALRPGTAGKSLLRNMGAWSVDLRLAKNFRVREATNLEFYFDMFNALNHVNLGGANGSIDNRNFGRITGAAGMRSMQAGFRLTF